MSDARIPLIDLTAQYDSLREEIDSAVLEVLARGQFILGPRVAELETAVASYIGVDHAVAVASGTDALLLTLHALGIGAGDEVLVPAFTFFATAEVVVQLGATPVLVDIEPDSYGIDPAQLEAKLSERTKAIIPVHLFGHPCDIGPIVAFAASHDLAVVEDNAQALGASYRGRAAGSFGIAGCLSFYPTKNLGAYGDGGMVVTNDEALAETLRMLRTHGWKQKYYPEIAGYNSRLDELQAAILLTKLPHLDRWNEARRRLASRYTERLADLGVGLPIERDDVRNIYHLYVIEVDERDRVIRELAEAGIDTAVYYPYALHQVPAFAELGSHPGDFPASERAAERCLAIPIYPELSDQQLDRVAGALKASLSGS